MKELTQTDADIITHMGMLAVRLRNIRRGRDMVESGLKILNEDITEAENQLAKLETCMNEKRKDDQQ